MNKTEEQNELEAKPETTDKPQQAQSHRLMPCEVDIFFTDKINEKLVTIDQPQILPNGMLQCHCGEKIVIYNPGLLRRVEIKLIQHDEKRIIS